MDIKKFKQLHKQYSREVLSNEILFSKEYDEYLDALYNNAEFRDLELKRRIRNAGMNYKNYCCVQMAYYLIEDKLSRKSEELNYDAVVTHTYGRKEFGIPIHDGGSSYIKINYCPWCGKSLLDCNG